MGKPTPADQDLADVRYEIDLAAGAASGWVEVHGSFNVTLLAGTGTAGVERSFDGGATAVPCTALGAAVVLTAPCSEQLESRELGLLHRIKRLSGAGTLRVRLSQ